LNCAFKTIVDWLAGHESTRLSEMGPISRDFRPRQGRTGSFAGSGWRRLRLEMAALASEMARKIPPDIRRTARYDR
jgi:hypothetical protein